MTIDNKSFISRLDDRYVRHFHIKWLRNPEAEWSTTVSLNCHEALNPVMALYITGLNKAKYALCVIKKLNLFAPPVISRT